MIFPALRMLPAAALMVLVGASAWAGDALVTIDNFAFSPAQVTVSAGARVMWSNHDDMVHQVADAASPRTIRSPPLDTGDSYARSFPKPGRYKYFCSLHPRMQGVVIVQ